MTDGELDNLIDAAHRGYILPAEKLVVVLELFKTARMGVREKTNEAVQFNAALVRSESSNEYLRTFIRNASEAHYKELWASEKQSGHLMAWAGVWAILFAAALILLAVRSLHHG